MMFRLRYVHKISQVCKCGRFQYNHSRVDDKGKRVYGEGPFVRFHDGVQTCDGYEPATELVDLPEEIYTTTDPRVVGKILREHKLLLTGQRLSTMRHEDGKLVCFPQASIWHSMILWPEVSNG